ncbi:MAG: hypothetical protein AB1454_04095 [Candidatus Auribacterota bacterium]
MIEFNRESLKKLMNGKSPDYIVADIHRKTGKFISPSAWRSWLRGDTVMNVDKLCIISEYSEKPIEHFFVHKPNKHV